MPFYGPNVFRFPNEDRDDRERIEAAFAVHGLKVEDVCRE